MSIFRPEPADRILEKALAGERITAAEAIELYESADFIKVMVAAREIRNRLHDPQTVTYTMFRIVNYTNGCNVECSFCSYHRPLAGAPVMTAREIVGRMRQAAALGADQLFLQGGVNPGIPFGYYVDVIREVKQAFPGIHIRAFSPVELLAMERQTGRPLREILRELKSAGMDSVPGAGAEILSDRMRARLSPRKGTVADWVRAMECCHEEGLPGSASLVFGSDETREEVIGHLEIVRRLQDRTGGFLAFIPWTFQAQTSTFAVRRVPAMEYLKVLGISRIFLDNIPHIEASILTLGRGTGAVALWAGADDISSVVIEENVLKSYGLGTEREAREFIRESGFRPDRRDLLYR